MEFGIFSQMHVPPWDDEHSRYLRELEVSLAVEAAVSQASRILG